MRQSLLKEPRNAVIDLNTAAIIEAGPECPNAEMLAYERPNGMRTRIHTHKLMKQVLVRHAYELSVTEGGSVKEHQCISEHFIRKTGFGQ